MQFKRLILLASLALASPSFAQEKPVFTDAELLDLSRSMAKLIGMSPAGTTLYAEEMFKRSRTISYREIEEADLALAEELERDAPDQRRLQELADRVARAAAAINAQRSQDLIAVASRLSPADRKILARFKSSLLQESLAKQRPVTAILPSG